MKRANAALGLSVLVVASSAACSGDVSSSAPGSTAPRGSAVTTTTVGAAPATGVVTSDDPRAAEIVDLVEASLPELQLFTLAPPG